MINAGVAIDSWKLDIFRKHLDADGFKYSVHSGLTIDTLTIKVETESAAQLLPTVKKANDECARRKMQ